jgi:hypothetical protein
MGKRIPDMRVEVLGGAAFRQYDDACLEKVEVDEPIFVLRAHDPMAPTLVRIWAERWRLMHLGKGTYTAGRKVKVKEAIEQADAMDTWYEEHVKS